MLEAISIDAKTLIVKGDKESDIAEVIDFISRKDKQAAIDSLLRLASEIRLDDKDYKFNRDECYDR